MMKQEGKDDNDVGLTWDNGKMHKSIGEWCLRKKWAQEPWDAPKEIAKAEMAYETKVLEQQAGRMKSLGLKM